MIYKIVGCLLLTTTVALSQPLQIRGGLNISTLVGGVDSYKVGPGFYFGVAKDYNLGREKVTFQPGVFYSLQSFKSSGFKYSLQYFHLPMLLNFKIAPKTGLLLGPQLGLLARAKVVDTATKDTFGGTPWFNLTALSVALGFSTAVNDHLNFDLRGSLNVFKPGEVDVNASGLNVQIGMSYLINKNIEEK